jgi:hypothetical protein
MAARQKAIDFNRGTQLRALREIALPTFIASDGKRVSRSAMKNVLRQIDDHAGMRNWCTASVDTLADELHLGRRVVLRALEALRFLQLVIHSKVPEDRRRLRFRVCWSNVLPEEPAPVDQEISSHEDEGICVAAVIGATKTEIGATKRADRCHFDGAYKEEAPSEAPRKAPSPPPSSRGPVPDAVPAEEEEEEVFEQQQETLETRLARYGVFGVARCLRESRDRGWTDEQLSKFLDNVESKTCTLDGEMLRAWTPGLVYRHLCNARPGFPIEARPTQEYRDAVLKRDQRKVAERLQRQLPPVRPVTEPRPCNAAKVPVSVREKLAEVTDEQLQKMADAISPLTGGYVRRLFAAGKDPRDSATVATQLVGGFT